MRVHISDGDLEDIGPSTSERALWEAQSIAWYGQDVCYCFIENGQRASRVTFHGERQDTTAEGWQHLLVLIDEAAADGREHFAPLHGLPLEQRRQIVTLPPTIAKLEGVKCLYLYRSNLVRLPPEIGAMKSLKEFVPYTSYRLHWFPYELTRCPQLRESTVSTRALYGNPTFNPPFPEPHRGWPLGDLDPAVWGASSIKTCSVCDEQIGEGGVYQGWVSRLVATDVLPLLVNACSPECLRSAS